MDNVVYKNIIPVCVSTDENIWFSVLVLFSSILENANDSVYFKFYVFVPNTLQENERQKIINHESIYKNCSITIIDMQDKYLDNINQHPLVTNTCLYKFAILDKLPQYDKVLYLDTDILVNGDLLELYNIDLKDNYVGAVFNIYYYKYKKYLSELLKIPDMCSYFNAGVMLMNLKKMREDNILPQLEKYIGKFKDSVDQHIFNKVCYGKILNIHPKYNVTPGYVYEYQSECAEAFYTRQELNEAINSPLIFHWAGKYKPWNTLDLPLSIKWLRYNSKLSGIDFSLQSKPVLPRKNWFSNIKNYINWKTGEFLSSINEFFKYYFHISNDLISYNTLMNLYTDLMKNPIMFIFDNLDDNQENRNLLELINDLKEKELNILVVTKKNGKLRKQLELNGVDVFKLDMCKCFFMQTVRICNYVILNGEELAPIALNFYYSNQPYIWLMQDIELKNKLMEENLQFQQTVICSQNVIDGFDKKQLLSMLAVDL